MNYYEVTTVTIIDTGYHFHYDVTLASSKEDAMDSMKTRYGSETIEFQTVEPFGVPNREKAIGFDESFNLATKTSNLEIENQQLRKRGPGRPRKATQEKRIHIDVTLSQQVIDYLNEQPLNRGRFIERCILWYIASYPEDSPG